MIQSSSALGEEITLKALELAAKTKRKSTRTLIIWDTEEKECNVKGNMRQRDERARTQDENKNVKTDLGRVEKEKKDYTAQTYKLVQVVFQNRKRI